MINAIIDIVSQAEQRLSIVRSISLTSCRAVRAYDMIDKHPAPRKSSMRTRLADIIAISILCCIVGIFFFRLFFPILQLIVTPDFGRSDAWHFSFATKAALSQSLKAGQLPLWRPDIGDGFPLLAEGQTGTYFLPNLILFSALSAPLAYNVASFLSILMIAIGTYLLCRVFGLSIMSSIFGAITFALSGLPILQLPHISLLQGMSMLPYIFLCTLLLTTRNTFPWMAILSLLITQQLFTGFPQAAFLTLMVSGLYVLWYAYIHKTIRPIIVFSISVLLGFSGAAAQIVPSWEFLRSSTFPSGFDFTRATEYSMPLRHLVTFINPFALGNPKYGTYPPFYAFDGSIFWENTAYIGILPILFIGIAGFFQKKHRSYILFFACVLIGGLLMAWGKNSPLYLLYSFWPLNLFRVPSRFLWLSVFSAVMLAAFGFDYIAKKYTSTVTRLLLIVSLIVTSVELSSIWWSYHLMTPVSTLIPTTHIPAYISTKKVYTLGTASAHNTIYLKNGWKYPKEIESLYTNAYAPDANILFHVNQHDIYAGRFLYRSSMADAILSSFIQSDTKTATISSTKMLDMLGIETVISYVPVDSQLLRIADDSRQQIYANADAVSRAYLVRTATEAATVNEATRRIIDPLFKPGKSAVIEPQDAAKSPALATFLHTKNTESVDGTVTIIKSESNNIQLTVNSGKQPSLLILTDTYYPGWVARIDGVETRIYPANVKQRAVVIPDGNHTVTFSFEPKSVSVGLQISILVELIVGCLMVVPLDGWTRHIGKITHLHASGHRHNRGM